MKPEKRLELSDCWNGVLMIRTGMRGIIELIRKQPKIRRILRCESPYFHH